MSARADFLSGAGEAPQANIETAPSRERIATAALQGLLAATPAATQSTTSADAYARRAVRYADALLEALNISTSEAIHGQRR